MYYAGCHVPIRHQRGKKKTRAILLLPARDCHIPYLHRYLPPPFTARTHTDTACAARSRAIRYRARIHIPRLFGGSIVATTYFAYAEELGAAGELGAGEELPLFLPTPPFMASSGGE